MYVGNSEKYSSCLWVCLLGLW